MWIAPTAMKLKNRTAGRARSLTRSASRVITRRASSRLCLQTAIRVTNQPKQSSRMRSSSPRLTIHSSNTTMAITRGFPVCYVIVVKTIHRNRRCRAKQHTRLAPVVTRSSSQTRRARSALSVTQTRRAERSKHFHRCAVSMRGSITRSTVMRRVLPVTGEIVVGLGCRFLRGLMLM